MWAWALCPQVILVQSSIIIISPSISASAHLSNIHTSHSHVLMNQTSSAHTPQAACPSAGCPLRNDSTGSSSFPVSGCVRGNRASGSISDTRKQNSDMCVRACITRVVRTWCSSCSHAVRTSLPNNESLFIYIYLFVCFFFLRKFSVCFVQVCQLFN